MGKQSAVLKDHPDPAPLWGDEDRGSNGIELAKTNRALAGMLEAGDAPQQGCLSAPARAEQRKRGRRLDAKGDVEQHIVVCVGVVQPVDSNVGRRDRVNHA